MFCECAYHFELHHVTHLRYYDDVITDVSTIVTVVLQCEAKNPNNLLKPTQIVLKLLHTVEGS